MGQFNLFIKLIEEEYKLTSMELSTLRTRLLADDREFEKVWKSYKSKSSRYKKGVDDFKFLLQDLIH